MRRATVRHDAEALLALVQRLLRPLALRDVFHVDHRNIAGCRRCLAPARSCTRPHTTFPLRWMYRFSASTHRARIRAQLLHSCVREGARSSGWVSCAQAVPSSSCSEYPSIRQNAAFTWMMRPSSPLTHMPNGACSKTSRNRSSLSRSFRSARTRWPMSRAMPEAPTTSPAGFRIGETESETSIARPSFPWRTVSKGLTLPPFGWSPRCSAHFVAAAGWSENGSVLSDDFLARVSEQRFGAPVPTDDGAVQAYAVNRVVRRFHDRGQQSPGLLGLLALRDIAENGGNGYHFTGGVSDGGPRYGYVKGSPVLVAGTAPRIGRRPCPAIPAR